MKKSNKKIKIGSWITTFNPSAANLMSSLGFEWLCIDLEHSSIDLFQMEHLISIIEKNGCQPFVRVGKNDNLIIKRSLDSGARGIIVPMIEDSKQLEFIRDSCRWPPAGKRGVGFSRANLFGKNFNDYVEEAQKPLLVAMIESIEAVDNLESILQVKGLDAILIGPYDLSASMNLTTKFSNIKFINTIERIRALSDQYSVACGIHVVEPKPDDLKQRIDEGYQFIAYSVDSVFLSKGCENPIKS